MQVLSTSPAQPGTLLTPTIVWAAPASITYGTPLSATQLNATSSVPGTFVYSPSSGSMPSAGTIQLSVAFTPQDPTKYASVSASVSLVVAKATPPITWAAPASVLVGTVLSATQLDAVASIPGSFAYNPAAGSKLPVGTNTLQATFTPTDSANFVTVSVTTTLLVTIDPNATNIEIGSSVLHPGMKRLGMNINGQNFYDSGQLLRNLTFRNPGFEGETWQSILRCSSVTATTCTDGNTYAQWPANFLQGATFEFIYGAASGETGTVIGSAAASASANVGTTLQLSSLATSPAVGDFVVVRKNVPGNAQAGWWPTTGGGGTLSTEFTDLSPNTIGKQALRLTASGAGQSASVDSYFDSTNTHNFVLLNGAYVIQFRAKGAGGNNQLNVSLARQIPNGNYFNQTLTLSSAWQDYTLPFIASEPPSVAPGTLDLHFQASGASVLLDDVTLQPATATAANPTVFRDEVVSTLTSLHPGSLRYMDGLPSLGSSIDNMLTPAFGRLRAGSSTQQTEQDDIAIGLHEFLQLCQTVGAEPWYSLPPAISPLEMQNLVEYLGGDATTPYGAKRAALGQVLPWTTVFPMIHLELGNEQWNYATFPGNAINDPIAYGKRVATIFGAARSSAAYSQNNFDLIMGSFVLNPFYTGQEIASSSGYDSVSVAPYLLSTLNDTSSNEAIFGPLFAQPEMFDSVSPGWMAQQSKIVQAAGKKLVTYEENIATTSGTASQSMVNAVVPSVAGGIAMADHMLLQMRDLGVTTQNVWALPGYANSFNNTHGGTETSPVFGTVIDMGGQSNLRRPVFLAEQLVNTAILANMLSTTMTGANPTWNQPLSTNDSIQLNGAHFLQAFAFSDGNHQRSAVVINLSRTSALSVTFSGANAPTGTVLVSGLTSANLTDNNETSSAISLSQSSITNFQGTIPYSLPPFSLTVFTWSGTP
ncbi:hypothetical protein [Granulicella pectinivorans]|uniref:hypothetical protein n=1 Tax=Granulicella pectinivorans TaxID=474950 RepID=UPI000B7F96D5|nr:hypothetical protein [Granulicella pectinivorans]